MICRDSLHFTGQARLERKAYMIAPIASPVILGDAHRRGALWEGRPTLLTRLIQPVLVTVAAAPFWGTALVMMRNPPAGPEAEIVAHYALLAIPLGITFLLVSAAITRAAQLRYRLDAQAVEVWRRTRERRMEIAEIRALVVKPGIFGQQVLVRRGPWGGIAMLLRRRDADSLLAAFSALGIEESPAGATGIDPLAPDEPVRWRGNLGLGTFDAGKAILAGALLIPPLLLGIALWSIWDGNRLVAFALLQSAFVLLVFGGLVFLALVALGERLRIWLFEALGTVLVTDRRIAWCAPRSGSIYRELALAELVDALIVEEKRERAWVALTVRHRDDVRDEDLHGVPDAQGFLAALNLAAR
jgi:hypothetical protein